MNIAHISLEDIDIDSVASCTDAKVLAKYIQLLRADGGYFPELLQSCEERLKTVDPNLAQKLQPHKISPELFNETQQLLLQWETELRSFADCGVAQLSENSAPVRNAKLGTVKSRPAQPTQPDTFSEDAPETETVTCVYPEKIGKISEKDADSEIRKGLEGLRAGDATEAEYFFSRSIAANSQHARGFFHRAEARTALGKHREALEDIQTALALDISLGALGGFAIRANLRAEAGFLDDAENDFLKALDAANACGGQAELAEKIDRQLRLLRSKKSDEAKKNRAETFTKISIVEVDDDEEEEPKFVEITDDNDQPTAPFTKVSVIEEPAEPSRRRIPVRLIDDEDD